MNLILALAVIAASLFARSWVPGLIAAAIAGAFAAWVTWRNATGLGLEPRAAYLAGRVLAPILFYLLLRAGRAAWLRWRRPAG
jgi:hypothetical protein